MTFKFHIQEINKRLKQRAAEKKYLLSFMQQFHIEHKDKIHKNSIPFFTKNTTDAIIWINNKRIGIELTQYNADAIRKGQAIKSDVEILSKKICRLKRELTENLSQNEFKDNFKKKYPNESICSIGIDFTGSGMKRLNSLSGKLPKPDVELTKLTLEVSREINNYIFKNSSKLKLINITYFSPTEKNTSYFDLLKKECMLLGIPVKDETPPAANAPFIDLSFSYLSGHWYALTAAPIINQIEQKKIKYKKNYCNGQFDEVWLVLHTSNSRLNDIIGHRDTIIQCRLPGIQKELSLIDHPFQRIFLLSLGQDGFMLDLTSKKNYFNKSK